MKYIGPHLARTTRILKPATYYFNSTRKMSLFPRFVSHSHEFSPLLQLLDEFATVSRNGLPDTSSIRAFTPKFDVRESKDAYELHGELPGIEHKDIQIEWGDSQTLSIAGR